MRKIAIVTGVLSLLLGACTGREILVTEPTALNVKMVEVKGSKIIFSVNPDNQDATYAYSICSEGGDLYPASFREQARTMVKLWEESEYNKELNRSSDASFSDIYFYRGSRTIRITALQDDYNYKLAVFQIDPVTHEILGTVFGEQIHTPAVKKEDLHFTFQADGEVLTIIPSDQERIYYWDFDPVSRVYDNFFWPKSFIYNLLEMYDQYGFSDEVYSMGTEEYDFSTHHLMGGEEHIVVASACDDGEITSKVTSMFFKSVAGAIEIEYQIEE